MGRRKKALMKRRGALIMILAMLVSLIQPIGGVLIAKASEVGKIDLSKVIPVVKWLDGSEMSTGKDKATDYESARMATDGNYEQGKFFRYGENENSSKECYVEYDLGKMYDINQIKMWRYYDGRNYTPTAIALSDEQGTWNTSNANVVYSSDLENIFGLGSGSDEGYSETAEGKSINCNASGRYVRIYSKGNSINTGNHLVEFEVYGKEYVEPVNAIAQNGVTVSASFVDGGDAVRVKDDTKNGALKWVLNYDDTVQGGDWYAEIGFDNVDKPSYLQIDLGNIYDLNKIKMLRYDLDTDGRVYDGTVIVAAETVEDFTKDKATVFYNSDSTNNYGFGEGTDNTYNENDFSDVKGKEFKLANGEAKAVRYIRVYMQGSNKNSVNHVKYMEAWGTLREVTGDTTYSVIIPTEDGYEVVAEEGSNLTGIQQGESLSFKVNVNEGFKKTEDFLVKVNNEVVEANENGVYTINDIRENKAITVEGIKAIVADNERITYLSDIKWISATAEGGKGTVRLDGNYNDGGNLTGNNAKISLGIDDERTYFDKGIGTHAESVIVYNIAGMNAKKFHAVVGPEYYNFAKDNGNEANNGELGDIKFQVFFNDETEPANTDTKNTVYSLTDTTSGEINLDIPAGVSKLTLKVTNGGRNSYNDWGNWGDARIVCDYPEKENLALNKDVVVKKFEDNTPTRVNSARDESMAVDGIKDNVNGNYCDFGYEDLSKPSERYSSYLQIDLKGEYELSDINLWRYWADRRTYNGTVIAVSSDSTKANSTWTTEDCTVIYNSDYANRFNLGAGTDELYSESSEGMSINLEDRFANETVSARYVRIYVAGHKNGQTNHIVECEVNGYNFGTKPYIADALPNAENYISLPTHYNENYGDEDQELHLEGQVTHPDIVRVPGGWNGHEYWMIYTPNVMRTSQYENPYIVYSDDGINWSEPMSNGQTVNPIQTFPGDSINDTKTHNCDGDIVYDPVNDRMIAYWEWSDDTGRDDVFGIYDAEIRARVSYDGIEWGIPAEDGSRTVTKADDKKNGYITLVKDEKMYSILSPSITYDNYKEVFLMYTMNAGDAGYNNNKQNFVEVRYSNDGLKWSEPQRINNFLDKDEAGRKLTPWHQDIQYIPELNEYWALSQCFGGANPDGSVIYFTKSKDGLNWTQVGDKSIISKGEAPAWDDFQIYRSTFLYNEEEDKMEVWYSALQTTPGDRLVPDSNGDYTLTAGEHDDRIWRVGYTENSMTEIMKALTKNEYYEAPKVVKSQGFKLEVEDRKLNVGEGTSVTAVFADNSGKLEIEDKIVTDKNLKFTSDNEAVATVDPWGKVTAESKGQAIIKATTKEGGETDILITVGEQQHGEVRHVISNDKPLYISNYYWTDGAPAEYINACDGGQNPQKNYITVDASGNRSDRDDPLKLWNTIPDDLKDNTVVLLIAERSIRDDVMDENDPEIQAVRNWIKQQVEYCNANQIPCAVQNINGETSTWNRIPLTFWKELMEENEYLVGFNGAELYNCFSGGEAVNNADEHVSDLIRLGSEYGVSMMWTDTNVFGNGNGVLANWLEKEDSELLSAMKDNSEFVTLMTKTSYGFGAPNTTSMYLGLWLAGYIGNWGVASDWWHWQLDGNGGLFGNNTNIDGGWESTLIWPENMYSQDILSVASMGSLAYKSEPQWYSVASNGNRTPSYQYSVMPTLQKLSNGEIDIPTKEEVMDKVKLIVKGKTNFKDNLIYDTNSNLYMKTGKYGIVPWVPSSIPDEDLIAAGFNIDEIVKEPLTQERLDVAYPEEKGTDSNNTWLEHYNDTWYFMNNVEDKDLERTAAFTPEIESVEEVAVTMEPHCYGVVTEENKGLNILLSNYRVDKPELYQNGGVDERFIYEYIWKMSNILVLGEEDSTSQINDTSEISMRPTTVKIKAKEKPEITFLNEEEGNAGISYDNYTRPYTYTISETADSEGYWTIDIIHNGMVEFTVNTEEQKEEGSVEIRDEKGNVIKTEAFVEGEKVVDILKDINYTPINGYVQDGWKYSIDGEKYEMVTSETIAEDGMVIQPDIRKVTVIDGELKTEKNVVNTITIALDSNVNIDSVTLTGEIGKKNLLMGLFAKNKEVTFTNIKFEQDKTTHEVNITFDDILLEAGEKLELNVKLNLSGEEGFVLEKDLEVAMEEEIIAPKLTGIIVENGTVEITVDNPNNVDIKSDDLKLTIDGKELIFNKDSFKYENGKINLTFDKIEQTDKEQNFVVVAELNSSKIEGKLVVVAKEDNVVPEEPEIPVKPEQPETPDKPDNNGGNNLPETGQGVYYGVIILIGTVIIGTGTFMLLKKKKARS